jgi:HPt (histidine-containing phosphotransfer) domain-containing protein
MTAAQAGSRPGPAQTTDQIRAALHAAWEHARPAITARVHQLHRMILAMADTPLDTTLRAQAEREAHKLAGSAGTFGLHHASDLARELELILAGQPADPATTHRAGQLVASLRSEIDRPRATAEPVPAPATAPPGPLVLVVHADPRRAADWTAALRARGLTPVPAGDPRSGHAAAAHTHPTAAVIDVDGAGVTHDVAQLLEHLTRAVPRPPCWSPAPTWAPPTGWPPHAPAPSASSTPGYDPRRSPTLSPPTSTTPTRTNPPS